MITVNTVHSYQFFSLWDFAMFHCTRKFFFFFSSNRNPITDSSWCGVLCSKMTGLLHAFFRNNSEARVYLWDSKCWEYEDTSWHSWISVRDGNFICFFSMIYTFIFQSRCANNFVMPLHQANLRDEMQGFPCLHSSLSVLVYTGVRPFNYGCLNSSPVN